MITVEDPDVAERLRRLRAHAMDVSDLARHGARDVVFETYSERAFNARMTDMQAAMGLCQLEALELILAKRRRLAQRYTAAIAAIPGLETPYDPSYAARTWQSYCVRVAPHAPISRTNLMRRLLADGFRLAEESWQSITRARTRRPPGTSLTPTPPLARC